MNFKEFEELISRGMEKVILTENVSMDDSEEETYMYGIEIFQDNLIIDGNGHTINGNNKISVFIINAKVKLKNIVFKSGYSEYPGGAIFNDCDLIIENCRFENNCSEDYGGAIFNASNSKLLINNSKFIENRANFGGAIFADTNSELNLNRSIFKSNSSEFEGGAIFNKAELSIYHSLFSENASFKGGAIYTECFLNINGCDFENNIASEGNNVKYEIDK
nr:hypothetical protein [uncultured Methanobrevibacter sp.]